MDLDRFDIAGLINTLTLNPGETPSAIAENERLVRDLQIIQTLMAGLCGVNPMPHAPAAGAGSSHGAPTAAGHTSPGVGGAGSRAAGGQQGGGAASGLPAPPPQLFQSMSVPLPIGKPGGSRRPPSMHHHKGSASPCF